MKLTLRELFLLVAVVAVCCGWWVEHRSNIALREEVTAITRRKELQDLALEEAMTKIWELRGKLEQAQIVLDRHGLRESPKP
jgi:hypothetical protein